MLNKASVTVPICSPDSLKIAKRRVKIHRRKSYHNNCDLRGMCGHPAHLRTRMQTPPKPASLCPKLAKNVDKRYKRHTHQVQHVTLFEKYAHKNRTIPFNHPEQLSNCAATDPPWRPKNLKIMKGIHCCPLHNHPLRKNLPIQAITLSQRRAPHS